MIRVSQLQEAMGDGDWVAVTPAGKIVEVASQMSAAPATMIVRSVTDALKAGEAGRLTASVDRGQTWAVEAFVLGRTVVGQLEQEELTGVDLIDAVENAGHSWQACESPAE